MDRTFDITLRDAPAPGRGADRLWEDLSSAAECPDPAPSAREMADRIHAVAGRGHITLPLCRAIYGIVREAAIDLNASCVALGRTGDLILLLRPATLAAALRLEVDPVKRAALLKDAALLLPVPALIRLALTASAAFEKPLSPAMRRLLERTAHSATTAPAPDGPAAESLLRQMVGTRIRVSSPRELPADVTPAAPPRAPGRVTPEADRLVQIALESGAQGEIVRIAVEELVEQGRIRELLSAVKRAPDSAAATAVTRRVATPAALAAVLDEDPVDQDILDVLIAGMGIAAAKPLLEALAESRSRTTRRLLLDRLARLGSDIAPLVEGRLRDSRWFVVRNMLAVLRAAGCTPEAHVVGRFLEHKDARVRREAIQLLLENPRSRERAVVAGLRDTDRVVLRTAIQNARVGLPEDGVPILAGRLRDDMEFPVEFRVMALHLIGKSRRPEALDALLHYVASGKTLLGRPRLAPKSPEMLSALGGLARSWAADRRAKPLVDAARRSRDPQIAGAVRPFVRET